MVDALAAAMGRRAEFVPSDWETLVSALQRDSFDVIVNGAPFLIAFDIAALAGENNALDRSLFVNVPASGEVTVQLAERQAHDDPILNAVRVTHRPDH